MSQLTLILSECTLAFSYPFAVPICRAAATELDLLADGGGQARLIDGKEIAATIRGEIKEEVLKLKEATGKARIFSF